MAHDDETSRWIEAQLTKRSPGGRVGEENALQALADTLATLRGCGNGLIFGAIENALGQLDRSIPDAAIVDALHTWRASYEAEQDEPGLRLLSQLFGKMEPCFHRPWPVPPPDFGDRRVLGAVWQARLAALDEAIASRRPLNLTAIAWAGLDETPDPAIRFGSPDPALLYAFSQGYEEDAQDPFPLDLAAFFVTVGSLDVDDDPVLRPVSEWRWEDDGLCIGCGGYVQGSLLLADELLSAAPVVDRDDDGIERLRHDSFAAFVDSLLGMS